MAKLYMSTNELTTVGAACVLVAVAAYPPTTSPADATIADQLKSHANELLGRSMMNPFQLKDFGLALIAQAVGE